MGSGPWSEPIVETHSPVPRLRPAPANLGGKKVNNSKSYVVQVGEQSLTIETGLLAMQAGGAVTGPVGRLGRARARQQPQRSRARGSIFSP